MDSIFFFYFFHKSSLRSIWDEFIFKIKYYNILDRSAYINLFKYAREGGGRVWYRVMKGGGSDGGEGDWWAQREWWREGGGGDGV